MRWLLLLACAALAADSRAAALGLRTVTQDLPATPAGFLTHDVLIDFEGQLFGQQMVVELTSGSIYQDTFGGDTAPSPTFLPVFPAIEIDTFVTLGGSTSDLSRPAIVIGGSTEFPFSDGAKAFGTERIDVAWAPSPGEVVLDQTQFLTARLTVSNDASGQLWYFSNADGVPAVFGPIRFLDGFFPLDLHTPVYPEPSGAVLVLLAGLVVAGHRPT